MDPIANAQTVLQLIRQSQKEGFIAGVIFSGVTYAAMKTAKLYHPPVRKQKTIITYPPE
jgi:hypothetical protein